MRVCVCLFCLLVAVKAWSTWDIEWRLRCHHHLADHLFSFFFPDFFVFCFGDNKRNVKERETFMGFNTRTVVVHTFVFCRLVFLSYCIVSFCRFALKIRFSFFFVMFFLLTSSLLWVGYYTCVFTSFHSIFFCLFFVFVFLLVFVWVLRRKTAAALVVFFQFTSLTQIFLGAGPCIGGGREAGGERGEGGGGYLYLFP